MESRTQGSRPRPRTQKKSKAKDSLSEDRHSKDRNAGGQGPRTQAQVLSKKKKKVFTKIFQAISKKKRSSQKFFKRSLQKNIFQKIFQALHKMRPSRPRPRTSKCVLSTSVNLPPMSGGMAPVLKNFVGFCQNNLLVFRPYFMAKNR